jgi:hypothetical protein
MIGKLILFIHIFTLVWCHLPREKPTGGCLIHNQKYSYEYLYASDDVSSSRTKEETSNHNIYTHQLGSVDDFDRLKWTITQAFGKSNSTVTIKSNQNEYLCASGSYQDIFRQRRKLFLKRNVNEFLNANCQWRLEQIGDKTLYVIWNDWHNEPLYAPSYLYRHDFKKRNVYLWKKRPSSSGQFKWFIDCRRGDFLFE